MKQYSIAEQVLDRSMDIDDSLMEKDTRSHVVYTDLDTKTITVKFTDDSELVYQFGLYQVIVRNIS